MNIYNENITIFPFVVALWFQIQNYGQDLMIELQLNKMVRSVVVIIFNTCITLSESYNSFYLHKWEGGDPIYRQAGAPENASKSLHACSRWCFQVAGCQFLSWSPGYCWQVGFCGTENVAERVYHLPKDPIEGWLLPYMSILVFIKTPSLTQLIM